jgi:translation elongation factor EF-4
MLHFNFEEEEIIQISAKTGYNLDKIIPAIVDRIPAPSGKVDSPPRGFLFNARYVEN